MHYISIYNIIYINIHLFTIGKAIMKINDISHYGICSITSILPKVGTKHSDNVASILRYLNAAGLFLYHCIEIVNHFHSK